MVDEKAKRKINRKETMLVAGNPLACDEVSDDETKAN